MVVLLDALGSVGDTFGRPEDCFAQLGARRTQYSETPPSPGHAQVRPDAHRAAGLPPARRDSPVAEHAVRRRDRGPPVPQRGLTTRNVFSNILILTSVISDRFKSLLI